MRDLSIYDRKGDDKNEQNIDDYPLGRDGRR